MKPLEPREGIVVTASELKKNFGKYLNCVRKQHDVVITKNGRKIARLTPYVTDIEQYFTVRENALDYQYGGKKVSYEEFMVINENSKLRMELINGEVYLLDSPNIIHQEILGRLYLMYNEYFKDKKCRVFFAPFDVHLKKKKMKTPDVVQPDILVVCDLEGSVAEKGRYMGTPDLVVEILSDTTRSKDMIDKLNSYMLSEVKEYWIIDPKQENIIVYVYDNHEVERIRTFEKGDIAQSFVFEGLAVNVRELFEDLI